MSSALARAVVRPQLPEAAAPSLVRVDAAGRRLAWVADSWPACTLEKPINQRAVTQTGTALVISGGQPYRVDLE